MLVALTVACQAEQPAVVERAELLPTYTPYPPPEPWPTYTPYPTPEPWPTYTPPPALEPLPTYTPWPTPEPLPTREPLPTHTPYPTPEPQVDSNWVRQPSYEIGFEFTLLNSDEVRPAAGPWALIIACTEDDEPGAFLRNTQGDTFAGADEGSQTLLVSIDGHEQEENWWYFPPAGSYNDYFSYWRAEALIDQLLQATSVAVTIPTSGEDFNFTFDAAGLDRHISVPQDVCEAGR